VVIYKGFVILER